MGTYTPITSIVVQFSHPDLHRLASGDIERNTLYKSTAHDTLVPDPVATIRHETQDLLIAACLRTGDMTHLPMIINAISFSWQSHLGIL